MHHYATLANPDKAGEIDQMTTGRTLPEPIAESSIPTPAGLKPPAWWPTGDVGAANLAAAREALRR